MKQFFYLVTIAALACGISACSNDDKNDDSVNEPTVNTWSVGDISYSTQSAFATSRKKDDHTNYTFFLVNKKFVILPASAPACYLGIRLSSALMGQTINLASLPDSSQTFVLTVVSQSKLALLANNQIDMIGKAISGSCKVVGTGVDRYAVSVNALYNGTSVKVEYEGTFLEFNKSSDL